MQYWWSTEHPVVNNSLLHKGDKCMSQVISMLHIHAQLSCPRFTNSSPWSLIPYKYNYPIKTLAKIMMRSMKWDLDLSALFEGIDYC
jgi:hypothetical protein